MEYWKGIVKCRHTHNFHSRTKAYTRITTTVCRRINCKCCQKIRSCQYDNHAKTYLHIIHELESKDIDIIMRSLANLN